MLWKGPIEPSKCGDRLLPSCDGASVERFEVAACPLRRAVQEIARSGEKYRPSAHWAVETWMVERASNYGYAGTAGIAPLACGNCNAVGVSGLKPNGADEWG